MELLLIIVMFMVVLSVLLKMTFLPQHLRVPVCVVLAFFVGECWEYAAVQSKSQMALWLQNSELMLDMAVVLTIDVFMQISFCILESRRFSGAKLSKSENVARLVTLCLPGILIFPTLLAILVAAIFVLPGVDFLTLAWSLAAIIVIICSFAPLLLKWLLPESDLRLELIFLINVMIAILGVVSTVNVGTVVAGSNSLEWRPLIGLILLFLSGITYGYFLFCRKSQKLTTQN